jgi:hypothetical protein
MGVVRNNINIEGLSMEEELPKKNNGQLITYSETNNLHISDINPKIKGIYEVSIEIDIVSKRTITTGMGKIIILDGLRKYKILYIENNESSSAGIVYLEVPYNTFIELPQNTGSVSEINIYILDAYYYLKDSWNIYEHLVYQLDVHYDERIVKKVHSSLIEEDSSEDSLIKRLSRISNVLNEAALSTDDPENKERNIYICYRNVDEVFM